jgi:hypothetical protein
VSDRAALAEADSKGAGISIRTIPLLHMLLTNGVVPEDESASYAARELDILIANNAPPLARLEVEWRLWSARNVGKRKGAFVRELEAALQAPHYASDPLARSALRLMIADYSSAGREKEAPLLRAVIDDSALDSGHPFKVGALMRLAAIEKASGDLAGARTAFDRTGLADDQCAMLDAPPKMMPTHQRDGDFPDEAMRWGFEGWVATQFDIGADGHTRNQRAVVAYPPFVFSASATSFFSRARFAATYRRASAPGCGGYTNSVNYRFSREP